MAATRSHPPPAAIIRCVGRGIYAFDVLVDGGGLLERPIDFGYAYRMRCSRCGRASSLTGAEYLRLNDEAEAHVDCAYCHSNIHFGPLAAASRDENDRALDDAVLNRVSWYHTSTYFDWPSAAFETEQRASLSTERVRALLRDPERVLSTMLQKALHLGTYEAAIENMYRRMRNQGDASSSFYLHRVEIGIRGGRVNAGTIRRAVWMMSLVCGEIVSTAGAGPTGAAQGVQGCSASPTASVPITSCRASARPATTTTPTQDPATWTPQLPEAGRVGCDACSRALSAQGQSASSNAGGQAHARRILGSHELLRGPRP